MSRTKTHFINYSEASRSFISFPRDHNFGSPAPARFAEATSHKLNCLRKIFAFVRVRRQKRRAAVLITELLITLQISFDVLPARLVDSLSLFFILYLPRTEGWAPHVTCTYSVGGSRVNANSNKIYFRRTRRSLQYFMSEMNIHGVIFQLTA